MGEAQLITLVMQGGFTALAAFLVWQRKDILERQPFTGAWAGTIVALAGCALHLLGQLATLYVVQQYALLVVIYGLVLALAGLRSFRLLCMPLLILAFMIPLPAFIYNNLSAQLQLLSSQLGVAIIRLFGISVFLEGNVIDLGVYKLATEKRKSYRVKASSSRVLRFNKKFKG